MARPRRPVVLPALVLTVGLCLALAAPAHGQLTRAQAVDALLAPGSGVALDTSLATVWSPFVDFGAGPGFEGLLAIGSTVDPAFLDVEPFPGPGRTLTADSYLFWIDDRSWARFVHPTRFAFVDASVATPTVANGGIVVDDQGWWPVVTWSGGGPTAFFEHDLDRTSASPAGAANPDGLVAGSALAPGDLVMPPAPPAVPPSASTSNACALLVRGAGGPLGQADVFTADMLRFEADLKTLYGLSDERIVKANGGEVANLSQLAAAVNQLVTEEPPCDKVYVRINSHAGLAKLQLGNQIVTREQLCLQMRKLANLGVPICLILECCHADLMLDEYNWNFPKGSSILTACSPSNTTGADAFETADGTAFLGGAFAYALHECAHDTTDSDGDGFVDADYDESGVVEDVDAFLWAKSQMPCYEVRKLLVFSPYYPFGNPDGLPGDDDDPKPGLRILGSDPSKFVTKARKTNPVAKADFHMVFAGDASGGVAKAWREQTPFGLSEPWADGQGQVQVEYFPETGETVVSWEDPQDPWLPPEEMHFVYCAPEGKGLRFLRQYSTPTTNPVAQADKYPGLQAQVEWPPADAMPRLRFYGRGPFAGGWGGPIMADVRLRASPIDLPVEHLAADDPLVAGLPVLASSSHVLEADVPLDIALDVPAQLAPWEYLVVETDLSWGLNDEESYQIVQFEPLETPAWTSVSAPLAGTPAPLNGGPGPLIETVSLEGGGPLTAGSNNLVATLSAPPLALGFMLVSLTELQAPFKGGVLVPAPDIILPHVTDAAGQHLLPFAWPPGIPAGIPFFVQEWLPDAGGPVGFASTNGLRGESR